MLDHPVLPVPDVVPLPESAVPGRVPSRRGLFLAATGAVPAAVLTSGVAAAAVRPGGPGQPAGDLPPRVDVHHHAMPAPVRSWLVEHGMLPPAGGPLFARWDLGTTLATMDQHGIQLAVLSAPVPTAFTPVPSQAAELATIANDSLGTLAREQPSRFGWLASVPYLEPNDAVAEIERVYGGQAPDGVLLTAHAGTRYLGDPALDPVMAALNDRDAVVLVHPFDLPGASPIAVPSFVVDFMADTTRAAVQLTVSGALDRFPRIQWILAHGGGAFPYLAGRLALGRGLGYGADPGAIRAAVRRFWYDTAGPMSPYATPSLLAAAGAGRILYGSDYNAIPAATVGESLAALRADPALDAPARAAIARGNALRLFPALAQRLG
ncbi:6-methylsalicylate decarboxylase [Frankia sp. Hr75.2]|nr:6-methylsalicylate decarboxylase [Frankia sp. Hr75.2]